MPDEQTREIKRYTDQIEAIGTIEVASEALRESEVGYLGDYARKYLKPEPVGKYEGRIIGVFQMEDFENLLGGSSVTSTYWFLDECGTCHSIDCTWNDLIVDPEMRYSEIKTIDLSSVSISQLRGISEHLKAAQRTQIESAAKVLA